jgi:hypothetical protein
VTESSAASPKAAVQAAKPPAKPPAKAAVQAAKPPAKPPAKAAVQAAKPPAKPADHHPNLGLAPADLTVGYTMAAEKLRDNAVRISAGALESAMTADPGLRTSYDEVGLRRLLRDGELLVERLAMCLESREARWLTEYAEWIGPIYRRRGVPLSDLGALCAGIRDTVEPHLNRDEFAVAERSLDAAQIILRNNGRLGGDGHKRNALRKWLYRGV